MGIARWYVGTDGSQAAARGAALVKRAMPRRRT